MTQCNFRTNLEPSLFSGHFDKAGTVLASRYAHSSCARMTRWAKTGYTTSLTSVTSPNSWTTYRVINEVLYIVALVGMNDNNKALWITHGVHNAGIKHLKKPGREGVNDRRRLLGFSLPAFPFLFWKTFFWFFVKVFELGKFENSFWICTNT